MLEVPMRDGTRPGSGSARACCLQPLQRRARSRPPQDEIGIALPRVPTPASDTRQAELLAVDDEAIELVEIAGGLGVVPGRDGPVCRHRLRVVGPNRPGSEG